MASITAADLVAWHAAQRHTGAAAWSIKARWTALRLVLSHAARHDYIAAKPADVLTSRERPKPGASRKRFLTAEEMQRLMEATPPRYLGLVSVLLFGGLRISEALGLVWGEVDSRSGHSACATSSAAPAIEFDSSSPRHGETSP